MALSNALFAGLSGLNVNQTKLNVVGNNIANVNTVAFKSTRVLFKPQFYVTDTGGSQPEGDFGGTNPSQRGLGAVVAALDKNFNTGSIETTGERTDMAIEGEGFFVVQSDETKYTRDGSFKLNPNQQLTTTAGDLVQGFGIDENFNIIPGALTNIEIPLLTLTTARPTTMAAFKGNLNSSGDIASGASLFTTQLMTTTGGTAPDANSLLIDLVNTADGTPVFTTGTSYDFSGTKGGGTIGDASFAVTDTSTFGELATFFQERLGINTTVPDDLDPDTPTPGVTIEADLGDPNSARLVIAGNTGEPHLLSLSGESFADGTTQPLSFAAGTNAAGNADDPMATGEGTLTQFVAYDSLGTAVPVTVRMTMESISAAGRVWRFYVESEGNIAGANNDLSVATGTLTFNSAGVVSETTGTRISISRSGTGSVTPLTFDLDFSQMTSFSDDSSELRFDSQDGRVLGTLADFSIGVDGKITGTFTNSLTRTLGQVAIATFSNPGGLVDRGGNMYVAGPNSGAASVGAPQSLGAGKIVAGALELSNVDLSEEFINLIIASTGFTAASRVITTSDQLISELLNTSR